MKALAAWLTLIAPLIFLVVMGLACRATLPIGAYPVEAQRTVSVPLERAWDAALTVVRQWNGIIVTIDKPTGLIVFGTVLNDASSGATPSPETIFYNILLKKSATTKGTAVYVRPRTERREVPPGADIAFLDALELVLGRETNHDS